MNAQARGCDHAGLPSRWLHRFGVPVVAAAFLVTLGQGPASAQSTPTPGESPVPPGKIGSASPQPNVTPAPQVAVDPCLIGTWRSNPIDPAKQPAPLTGSTGLGGVVLEFRSDGTETVGYSASEPHVYNAGDAVATYRGAATARVSAQDGLASVGEISQTTVTQTTKFTLGQTRKQKVQLGPAFLGVPGSTDSYRCSAGSLRFGTLPIVWSFSGGANPRTTERTPGPAPTPIGDATSGGTLLPIIAILILGLFVVGLTLFLLRKRSKPAAPPPAPPKVAEAPVCGCSGHLVLKGRNVLKVCECMRPSSWGLNTDDARSPAVLGILPDGDVFCARIYGIERIIAECVGGGSVPFAENPLLERATTRWDLQKGPGPDELTLSCSAKVWVHCPGKEPVQQDFAGEMNILLVTEPCTVSLVVNEDTYYKREVGHTGVRIRCGEYDTIFGYFPKGSGLKDDASYVAGFDTQGRVRMDTSRDDRLEDSVTTYYQRLRRREYPLALTCAQADNLRVRWLALSTSLTTFQLYQNNCTTAAVRSVREAVGLDAKGRPKGPRELAGYGNDPAGMAYVESPAYLSEVLQGNGVTPKVHEPGTPFAPRDH